MFIGASAAKPHMDDTSGNIRDRGSDLYVGMRVVEMFDNTIIM